MNASGLILFLIVLLLISGCKNDDICSDTYMGRSETNNTSQILIPVIEQTNTIGRKGKSLDCVSVTIVDSGNYADTLAFQVLLVKNDQITISNLRPGTFDIILDREDYFPVKINALSIVSGTNRYDEQILMYKYDVPFAITGEIGLTLKPAHELKQVASIYNVHSPAEISRVPGGYQIRLRYSGKRRTRKRSERLCRQLLNSPYVAGARPLANFTTVVPGI